MTNQLYYKTGGSWIQPDSVWVNVAGTWKHVDSVWHKESGVWQQRFLDDITPPDAPLITLDLVSTNSSTTSFGGGYIPNGRYIKVGIRANGLANDPTLKRIRVLTTYNGKAPTTQYGGTYTGTPGSEYPNEPWSDWQYNTKGDHPDTSVVTYKRWPRNALDSNILPGGQTYYFTAWAQDVAGNWSIANAASIAVPKFTYAGTQLFVGEARFQPNSAGSLKTTGFNGSSDLIQSGGSTTSRGWFFYGNQLKTDIGAKGPATITNAQIYLTRANDSGSAQANVYLFWHDVTSPTGLATDQTRNESTSLGTLGKGESKWFPIPQVMWNDLANGNLKGFGLDNKNPSFAAAQSDDFSDIVNPSTAPRCGEVHVTWTEQL